MDDRILGHAGYWRAGDCKFQPRPVRRSLWTLVSPAEHWLEGVLAEVRKCSHQFLGNLKTEQPSSPPEESQNLPVIAP